VKGNTGEGKDKLPMSSKSPWLPLRWSLLTSLLLLLSSVLPLASVVMGNVGILALRHAVALNPGSPSLRWTVGRAALAYLEQGGRGAGDPYRWPGY
jgi:hypothetical protein